MTFSKKLKILAGGSHPDTGEVLPSTSLCNTPDAIRLLFALADDLAKYEKQKKPKAKLTPDEWRDQNITAGKPARTGFRWSEQEKTDLLAAFTQNPDIQTLSTRLQRSPLAVAAQLKSANAISEETYQEIYRSRQP